MKRILLEGHEVTAIMTQVEAGTPLADITAKVTPSKMAHFVVRTKNLPALAAWYKEVFQSEAVFENEGIAFLHYDDEHHRIALVAVPGLEEPNHKAAGFDHVAFSYKSIGDLLYTYARLKKSGIIPAHILDHGPTTSFYYADPDGNQVELQVDNFDTLEGAHKYFQSEAFERNPIGVGIDADGLVARLEAGEPPEDLLSSGTRIAN